MARVDVVDLNADLGEVEGDLALLAIVTSANVACGAHAGDDATMAAAFEAAERHGVVVGAHASYDDRAGFGRTERGEPAGLVAEQVASQVERLAAFGPVRYLKLHGALYHRANRDAECAGAILDALDARGTGVRHVLAAPGRLLTLARARGWGGTEEGFCDRAYRADGSLVARGEPGAVLEGVDDVVAQAVRLAECFGSLCVHGDTPGALELARAVRHGLEAAGVELAPFA